MDLHVLGGPAFLEMPHEEAARFLDRLQLGAERLEFLLADTAGMFGQSEDPLQALATYYSSGAVTPITKADIAAFNPGAGTPSDPGGVSGVRLMFTPPSVEP